MPVWARMGACTVAGTVLSVFGFFAIGFLLEGSMATLSALLDFLWSINFLQMLLLALAVTGVGLFLGSLYTAWKERPLWFTVPVACALLASLWAVFLTGYLGIRYPHWYEGLREVVCFTLPFALGGSLAAMLWRRL